MSLKHVHQTKYLYSMENVRIVLCILEVILKENNVSQISVSLERKCYWMEPVRNVINIHKSLKMVNSVKHNNVQAKKDF